MHILDLIMLSVISGEGVQSEKELPQQAQEER